MSILFPYFELAASLFILLLCFQIFTRHYDNRVARFFAILALVAFLASILEYSLRIAFTLELARNINRLSSSLWAIVFPMFAHFSFVFAKKDRFLKNRLNFGLFYLPPAMISSLFIFTNLMYTRYEISSIGIINQPAPLYWLFALNILIYSAIGVITLFRFSRQTAQKTEKVQALLIASGSLIASSIGAVADLFLPLTMGYRAVFPTAVFDVAFMMAFIYYAMRRYSLFAVSPSIAADVIIETMPDALLATDFEGNILFMNEEADKLFCDPEKSCVGHPFSSLFKSRQKYDQLYDEVVVEEKEILRYEVDLVDPLGQHIPALINANLLRDKIVGDTIGIVFVVRDVRG
ncbi:MAG: histidine kinase N-terminal 7TM domain-containing protein [Candidatus Margulisiibacteriota bacterium]|nr:histidine kinase N-terminal 7TM domain-containing protein [Candidatus Margulisiibacteriota bacterium]